MEKESIYTIPNFLSFYRLIMFPVVLYFAITEDINLFTIFFVINLLTDVLDGFIARMFNQQTRLGARLDSLADVGSFVLAFVGVFIFRWDNVQPHAISFFTFLGLYLLTDVFALLKFKKISSFHLYSWKVCGYVQGIFFIVLFAIDFYEPFYYLMIVFSILAAIEHLIIQIIIKDMKSNLKGLYWVLKERNNG
jgi:cardiolipin synthase (CMP-forming)